MKICDRCKSENVIASWYEQRDGKEIDLCKACNEELEEFLKTASRGSENIEETDLPAKGRKKRKE